jgi:hypothetical protein
VRHDREAEADEVRRLVREGAERHVAELARAIGERVHERDAEALAAARSSTTSERTSATSALSGASSPQPMTAVVRDGDDEAPACDSTSSNVRGSRWPTLRFAVMSREWRPRLPRRPCATGWVRVHCRAPPPRPDRRFEQRQGLVDLRSVMT